MVKILHTSRYVGLPWQILKSVVPEGLSVATLEEPTRECLLDKCVDADYLLVSGRLAIDEEVLSAAGRLKMIQRTGVGIDMLDIEAIQRHHIPVYVNRGVNARSVAEHTLTLMLCSIKNIARIDKRMREGVWQKQQTGVACNEIFGKTVGLVGVGAIGRQVALYLKTLGAKVIYTDLHRLSMQEEEDLGIQYVESVDVLLPLADILSLHCPLTRDNFHLLDASALAKMKSNAVVVNTARGKLIDEKALFDALSQGRIRGAALDVHEEEPLKMPSALASLDNVILTPHIGGLTYEAFHSMMERAVENIAAFERGDNHLIEHSRLRL